MVQEVAQVILASHAALGNMSNYSTMEAGTNGNPPSCAEHWLCGWPVQALEHDLREVEGRVGEALVATSAR